MKFMALASKNQKELLRDPLSYIFCIGFPLIMLVIMSIVNQSIPDEAHMVIFDIHHLPAGIAVFGLTFIMLFTALLLSKDRSQALLIRLYTSPLTAADYILGYMTPVLIIAVLQMCITFASSCVIALIADDSLNVGLLLVSVIGLLPSAVLYIGLGFIFGSLLSDKSAPAICSIFISAAGMLGGIFMDIESLGGIFFKICRLLPFYHSVKAARSIVLKDYQSALSPIIVTIIYAAAVIIIAAIIFKKQMKRQ
ncbi:MAG: ABC transporter permease [Clostridiales bacterium]|nr:ABC transporter permease [Clostridiales bacterium]